MKCTATYFLYIGSQPEDLSKIADRIAIFGNGRILKNVEAGTPLKEILSQASQRKTVSQEERAIAADTQAVFRANHLHLDGVDEISFAVYS